MRHQLIFPSFMSSALHSSTWILKDCKIVPMSALSNLPLPLFKDHSVDHDPLDVVITGKTRWQSHMLYPWRRTWVLRFWFRKIFPGWETLRDGSPRFIMRHRVWPFLYRKERQMIQASDLLVRYIMNFVNTQFILTR